MAFSPPTSYAKDEEGGTFIAASQRPDGSWRKPRRVRDGYVPQEEVPLYESKGRQFTKQPAPQYPVGLDPALIRAAEARKEKAARTTTTTNTISPIPGLVLDTSKSKKKNKKQKSPEVATVAVVTESLSRASVDEWESVPVRGKAGQKARKEPSKVATKEPDSTPADPAKRLKNLRKRLREIEAIEGKIASGELKALEKDQIDKVARKGEVLREIEEMESMVAMDTITPV